MKEEWCVCGGVMVVEVHVSCQQHVRNSLSSPVDVAVTTPDALLKFRREGEPTPHQDCTLMVLPMTCWTSLPYTLSQIVYS